MMIRSRKVLASARSMPCTARFPGICNGDVATTVWCHLNGYAFGKGAGIKAHDILGFHGCSSCHAYYDTGHGTRPLLTNDQLLECVLGAVCETYVRLVTVGIVVVPRDIDRPSSERAISPRKPRDQRAKVQGASKRRPPPRQPQHSATRPVARKERRRYVESD